MDTEDNLAATERNRRGQDQAVVMHAEINCLQYAGKLVNNFPGMTLYSTLMPCHMCAGAIVQFGIAKVVLAESETSGRMTSTRCSRGAEVVDPDLAEAKEQLVRFIGRNLLE